MERVVESEVEFNVRVDIVGIDILGLITCRNLVWQRLNNKSQLHVKEDLLTKLPEQYLTSN